MDIRSWECIRNCVVCNKEVVRDKCVVYKVYLCSHACRAVWKLKPVGDIRKCTKCLQNLPIGVFRVSTRGYPYSVCRKCEVSGNKLYYDKDKAYFRRIFTQYNLTPEAYSELVAKHNNKCAICLNAPTKRRLFIDHDHDSGKVRGLLCSSCNSGLGNFKDSSKIIKKAINYLRKFAREFEPCVLSKEDIWQEHRSNPGKDPIINKSNILLYRYGIDLKIFLDWIDLQRYRCGCCQERLNYEDFVVDHDHASNQFRGVICMNCNWGLGRFKDNITVLKRAISYLVFHGK